MTIAKWIRRSVARIAKFVLLIVFVFFAFLLVLYARGFVDAAPEQDDCAIGSISNEKYRSLLKRARDQAWTVWPGLSDGIFWPSDRGIKPPSREFEADVNRQLLNQIQELSLGEDTRDERLAAAHAVMRSIGADLNAILVVPDLKSAYAPPGESVRFKYFLSQRRFAPLCLLCLLSPHTTLDVVFRHDLLAQTYTLDHVTVLHDTLKGELHKIDGHNLLCPAFPVRR